MSVNDRRGRRRARAGAAVLTAVLIAGCGLSARTTPDMRYYTLTVAGTPPARLPGPIRIGTFTIDGAYTTARLAYRSSPYRLDYYNYHRWAAEPRAMVATAARDYLERAAGSATDVPFELDGHVRRIEEVDAAAGWMGALALDLTLRRGSQVVLTRAFDETEPAEARNPEAVVAALSRALGRILDQLVTAAATAPFPAPAPVVATPAPRR